MDSVAASSSIAIQNESSIPNQQPQANQQLQATSTSASFPIPTNDPLSTLEDTLDVLLRILASTYSYITTKASHKQTHPNLPIWISGQAKESGSQAAKLKLGLVDEAVMKESIDELVNDLMQKSKEAEFIIKNLPDGLVDGDGEGEGEEKHEQELKELEAEMRIANDEYREALKEAKELHSQVSSLLREVTSRQQSLRNQLAAGALSKDDSSSKISKSRTSNEGKEISNKRLKGS